MWYTYQRLILAREMRFSLKSRAERPENPHQKWSTTKLVSRRTRQLQRCALPQDKGKDILKASGELARRAVLQDLGRKLETH